MLISILATLALFVSSNVKAQPLRVRDIDTIHTLPVLSGVREAFIVDCGKTTKAKLLINSFQLNAYNVDVAEVNASNELQERYGICLLNLTPDEANGLKSSKEIAFVNRDYTISLPPLEEDPLEEESGPRIAIESENLPYGIKMVQAPFLWNKEPKVNMTICVVDTGYGNGHEDLPNNKTHGVKGNGEYKDWYNDGHGHGTHCAGTIGAIGNNDKGVTSVNQDPDKFNFYIGKALDNQGSGSCSDVMKAIVSCHENGAKVISMSIGGCPYTEAENTLFKSIYDDNVLIVAAAGNNGDESKMYPASYPVVMSVAAVDANGKHAYFSQKNDQVEISAPGVSIQSTTVGEKKYTYLSGTSMATPHVAGGVAALWSIFPDCDNNQIRNVLLRTAQSKGTGTCNVDYGHGILQLEKAYDILRTEKCAGGGPVIKTLSEGGFGGCKQGFKTAAQCERDTDCDDGNHCTTDVCDVKGSCKSFYPDTCSYDKTKVTVDIQTDEYGSETSWDIKKLGSPQLLFFGRDYEDSKYYSKSCCLDKETYEFTIYDSFGDGMCCDLGNGSYTVIVNNTEILKGGKFDSDSVTSLFHLGATRSPTDSPTLRPTLSSPPTQSPTLISSLVPTISLLPTSVITAVPTLAPTLSSSPTTSFVPTLSFSPTSHPTIVCVSDHLLVTVNIVADEWAVIDKNRWEIIRLLNNETVMSDGNFTSLEIVKPVSACLSNEDYNFTIYDKYGDGICSDTSCGSYEVFVNNIKIISGGGTEENDFLFSMTATFNGIPPTSNPTISPTIKPTSSPTIKVTPSPTSNPTSPPSINPTSSPTSNPTNSPTRNPTLSRTINPTASPTNSSTTSPTSNSTASPTSNPTPSPTINPTLSPINNSTSSPTSNPTSYPTSSPTSSPTNNVTKSPTSNPTIPPTPSPTSNTTSSPTIKPTSSPTSNPTSSPSSSHTSSPTIKPTPSPTIKPTLSPTTQPTLSLTNNPTSSPTNNPTSSPTKNPTLIPTNNPTTSQTSNPTPSPSSNPTPSPTTFPTSNPTKSLSINPTTPPTNDPTPLPTSNPTLSPTIKATLSPTSNPTLSPTIKATLSPTSNPTSSPTIKPTSSPTIKPTVSPTIKPTISPTINPTLSPTINPTSKHTSSPTNNPTPSPSSNPTPSPTSNPSVIPSSLPSAVPSSLPTSYECEDSTEFVFIWNDRDFSCKKLSKKPVRSINNICKQADANKNCPRTCESCSAVRSSLPSAVRSSLPSAVRSSLPSAVPSSLPSAVPSSLSPTNSRPTSSPTSNPTRSPTSRRVRKTLPPTRKVRTRHPTHDPTTSPSNNPTIFGCVNDQLLVTVNIVADDWVDQDNNRWEIINLLNNEKVMSDGNFLRNQIVKPVTACLSDGDYNFTIYDDFGDGICSEKSCGSYEVFVNDIEIISGGGTEENDYEFKMTTTFNGIPPTSNPTSNPTISLTSNPSSSPSVDLCAGKNEGNFFTCDWLTKHNKEELKQICRGMNVGKTSIKDCYSVLNGLRRKCKKSELVTLGISDDTTDISDDTTDISDDTTDRFRTRMPTNSYL